MDDDGRARRLGELLRAGGWRMCAAESCTGGLILHRMTNIPGCSDYVLGGVVAYANAIKRSVLGVRAETLEAHGAVSAQTAEEMARGALALFGADLAISVTGIAGPGGATPGKPVGTTFIAAALRNGGIRIEHHVWPGGRLDVKNASADCALELAASLLQA
jgi:PncC family amidohydrolase